MSTTANEPLAAAHGRPLRPPADTRLKSAIRNRTKLYLTLYFLLLPMAVGMILFNYTPKWQEVFYSFYKWDGQFTLDFIGWDNYIAPFSGGDPQFWPTFQLVGILLVANLIKMWPSIFAAIVLHRIRSERWQYLYRVLFVIPMVIPGLLWILIWKNLFFSAKTGVLNQFLNATGIMHILQWLDHVMPTLASWLQPVVDNGVNPGFGSLWGMLVIGAMVPSMLWGLKGIARGWIWWAILLAVGIAVGGVFYRLDADVATNLHLPADTLMMNSGALFRFAAWAIIVVATGELARRSLAGQMALKWVGGVIIGLACFLILGTMVWSAPVRAFGQGAPSWLSNAKLVIPSLIFWGFPWVGTVGVLIYLAGLQQISNDVYEAAELDGVTSLGKAFRIELPLMMTQVRINLIFMTIGTLNDYGLVLLLLGNSGGPDGVGMVPGLYMYKVAFLDGRFGYGCALGMVLFVLILLITVIYQKYVKVDK